MPAVEIPLESYRLAQITQPICCYICEAENSQNAEFCRHCFAPMALAHQARANNVRPQMVAVIGASGAGKTVYLGILMDMLSRQTKRLSALARGAFSISLQQATTSALSRCYFPDKTPCQPDRWNWVHCQVSSETRRQPMELIVPDMAGEAILEEIDHPNTFPVIRALLAKCSGVIILIDAIRLQSGDTSHDFSTMKLLTFLSELAEGRKSTKRGFRPLQLPIALVFTKADQCEECFDDPAGFAEIHAGGMLRHVRERFARHDFYATGVAGACAFRESVTEGRQRIPLRIEPRGVVEPLAWMISQLPAKNPVK